VNELADREQEQHHNSACLRLRTGPLAAGVLGRVVSMMLARAECPLDRLDDALLVCDALCAHAPPHVSDGYLVCTVTVRDGAITLSVSELSPSGASGLVADAVVPGVGNLLERVTDQLRVEPDPEHGGQRLELVVNFA
jgi:serine/threonine-protein kinase RsbW